MANYRDIRTVLLFLSLTTASTLRAEIRAVPVIQTAAPQQIEAPEPKTPPFRTLESFKWLHVVQTTGPDGKLQREFIERLRPFPFGWIETSSIPENPTNGGRDHLVATVRRHPSIRAGVIVEFSDIEKRVIASVEASPPALRPTTTGSIIKIVIILYDLAFQTKGADRTVGSFSTLHIRTDSEDASELRERVTSRLRERGPWAIVTSAPDNRDDVLDCSLHAEASIPPAVRFKCIDANSRPVVSISGSNCRSCFGAAEFAPKGDMKRAADDLANELLAHRALMERLYAPQLRTELTR